jgi:hypothetical protein
MFILTGKECRILILAGIICLFGCSGRSRDTLSENERFEQYLLGMKYLEAADNLTPEAKQIYYKRLVAVTGISGKEAEKIIKHYYGNPEKWKKVVDSIIVKEERSDTNSKDNRKKDPDQE